MAYEYSNDWIPDWLRTRIVTEDKVVKEEDPTWITMSLGTKVSISDLKTIERLHQKTTSTKFVKLWENDDISFSLVNYLASKIAGQGYYFECEDEDILKKLEKWGKRIGLRFKLEDLSRDAIIYGTSWSEILYNELMSDIMDLKILDPDKMDFLRDKDDQVIMDDNEEPLAIVQKHNTKERIWYKDRIEEVSPGTRDKGNIIYKAKKGDDLRKHIAYFKLVKLGDSRLGISMLQPCYRSALIRTNLSDMVGESGFRGGGIVAYLQGNPTEEFKKNLSEDLKNITSKNVFVFSDRIKLDLVPIPELRDRERLIYQFADAQAGAFHVPLERIMATGGVSQQDLTSKMADLEGIVESYQERLCHQFKQHILNRLFEVWGVDGEDIFLKLRSNQPNRKLSRSRRLSTYARYGMLRYDPEIEKQIRIEENLPVTFVQRALDDWIKDIEKIPEERERSPFAERGRDEERTDSE